MDWTAEAPTVPGRYEFRGAHRVCPHCAAVEWGDPCVVEVLIGAGGAVILRSFAERMALGCIAYEKIAVVSKRGPNRSYEYARVEWRGPLPIEAEKAAT